MVVTPPPAKPATIYVEVLEPEVMVPYYALPRVVPDPVLAAGRPDLPRIIAVGFIAVLFFAAIAIGVLIGCGPR